MIVQRRSIASSVRMWCVLGLLPCVLPSPALADSRAPTNAEEASQHFRRGVDLGNGGDYAGAMVEFRRAYRAQPNYIVLYNIARCQAQLLQYAEALATYESYLQQGDGAVPADRRAFVEQEIARLRTRIVHVTITTNVAGAQVSIDGSVFGTSPLTTAVPVTTGTHTILAVKSGYADASARVDLAPGDNLEVQLALLPIPSGAPSPTAAAPTPVGAPIQRSSTPTWVAAGATLLFAGTSATAGVLALGARSDLVRARSQVPGQRGDVQ